MSATLTPLVALLALLAVTLLWFGLPMIPAILEMRRRRAEPLSADRDDGDPRHFAALFPSFLELHFRDPSLDDLLRRGAAQEGRLNDRTPYRIVETDGSVFLERARIISSIPALTIFSGALSLPDHLKFPFGAYGAADIETGRHAIVRFLYGRRNLRLKEGASVLSWIHAEGALTVEDGCALHGWASAEGSMQIGPGVEFERLHAERLEFGHVSTPVIPPPASELLAARLPAARPMSEDCFAVDGDLEAPSQTMTHGNFVARGHIRIGANARIEGDLRSDGVFQIASGAIVVGSMISGGDMEIGANCQIHGPVLAGRRLRIRTGAQIGREGHLTSVIAPSIVIEPGAIIYGTVWAREKGFVEAS
jgi:cytoskeletal protein CcmA (bactofilin family)